MESCDLDLEKLFDLSRFDYTQWMQQVASEDEACGSGAIRTLMSTYDIFQQLRYSALEDADGMITALQSERFSGHGVIDSARMEDPTYLDHGLFDDGHGQNCTLADAGRPVLEFASEIFDDHREEELSDGRMALAGSYENSCDNYDDIAENFAAEGLNEQAKAKRRGGRRHRNNLMKKPMGLAEIIMELLDTERRENALRCLSGHLIERRERDNRFYRTAAYQLYFSCSTLAILIQEVTSVYERIFAGDLSIRGSKRLANVLTCFQPKFQTSFYLSSSQLLPRRCTRMFEQYRYQSSTLLARTANERSYNGPLNPILLKPAFTPLRLGADSLNWSIAMSILESILHDEVARGVICRPDCNLVLDIVKMLSYLAAILGVVQDFSRRLIFQVVRCYTLLCQHPRALELVKDNFPEQLQDHTFRELKKVYPLFRILLHQLLLCIGKIDTYLPQLSPSCSQFTTPTATSQAKGKENVSSERSQNKPRSSSNKPSPKTPRSAGSPFRPLDLNKEAWHNLPLTFDYVQLVPNVD